MIPLIIDRRPSYLPPEVGSASLLTLPLGPRSFLDHLLASIAHVEGQEVLIMPTFSFGADYEQALASSTPCSLRVFSPEELDAVANEHEPADYLLVIDPARWPYGGFDLPSTIGRIRDYRGATHAIAVGADADRAREHVDCDEDGRVKRVQRLYNGVNWPEVACTSVFLSFLPARSLTDIRFRSLSELRRSLCARGVLSRDVPLPADALDLTTEQGLLSLHERRMADAVAAPHPRGFVLRRPEVLVGRECRIAPSTRLVGPVVIHANVTIDDRVSVVGPTVVGPGCHLREGAVIAQSVLAADTDVGNGACVRHRVVAGRCDRSTSRGSAPRIEPSAPGSGAALPDPLLVAPPVDAAPPTRRLQLAIKRAIDVVVSVVGLVVLAPVFLVVAIATKLESRGPVLFVHHRERKGGKEFPCLKFRTMTADAHRMQRELYRQNEVDGPQFMMQQDPRVTRVGRWLRATNIDELPQLVNVLWGHMSLVGPRPSPFRENQICVPWRRARLSVRSGITGLWQLCRDDDRSRGDFHEWIFYDLTYVREFSLWLDLKILWATLTSLGGKWSVPLSRIVPAQGPSANPPHRAAVA